MSEADTEKEIFDAAGLSFREFVAKTPMEVEFNFKNNFVDSMIVPNDKEEDNQEEESQKAWNIKAWTKELCSLESYPEQQ